MTQQHWDFTCKAEGRASLSQLGVKFSNATGDSAPFEIDLFMSQGITWGEVTDYGFNIKCRGEFEMKELIEMFEFIAAQYRWQKLEKEKYPTLII